MELYQNVFLLRESESMTSRNWKNLNKCQIARNLGQYIKKLYQSIFNFSSSSESNSVNFCSIGLIRFHISDFVKVSVH
jgi:hypothetical protein